MEESIRRRMLDEHGNQGKDVWEMVWKRMDGIYNKPSLDEGFDEIWQEEGDIYENPTELV